LDESGEKTMRSLEWRKQLGYTDSDLVILFAGKFEPRKNPFFLIELMQSIKESNVKLLFVGNGPLEDELKKQSKSDERIQFLDFQNQSDMPLIYRIANVFILPSQSETWGLAINEALVSGTKVLASKECGGAIDLIHSDNGLLFNPRTEIRKVIEYLKKHPNDFFREVLKSSLQKGHTYKEIIDVVKNEIK
jgi:glycosyltransferase involved in cell wall biosynthesis